MDAIDFQKLASALSSSGSNALFSGICARAVLGRLECIHVIHVYVQCLSSTNIPSDLDDLDLENGVGSLPSAKILAFDVSSYHQDYRPRTTADAVFLRRLTGAAML
jgi:hypothetical protein